jgi:hypothetical protein
MVTRKRVLEGNATIQPGDQFTFPGSYHIYKALTKAPNGTVFARKITGVEFVTSFLSDRMRDAIRLDVSRSGLIQGAREL